MNARFAAARPVSALTAVLALVASTLAALVLAAPASAAGGHFTPAVGVRPHYKVAGKAKHAGATFSCQTISPAQCYGPDQIRAAYGVDKLGRHGVTGAGRTIVIIDAYSSPTIVSDLATFNALFGLAAAPLNIIAPDGLTPFDPNSEEQIGWAGEITLDVEWAHAIAPGATIDLVLAKSSQDADILSAQRWVVRHNLGDVISQSFGEAEQCFAPTLDRKTHDVFAQATRQRQTLFASSADQGAALPTCDGKSFFKAVSTPAVDTYVTGVGGTELNADGLTGAYHSETTWNEPQYQAGTGGGFSTKVREPWYQKGAQHTGRRGVPDIAYNAGVDTGVLVVWSSSGEGADLVFVFGGTSAGSPQWAGLIALTDQINHGRVGAINPALYALAHSKKAYHGLFHDITTGNNTFYGPVTVPGYAARCGWDPATGLGTPKAQYLVPVLAAVL